jgi:hypothetical protein
VVEPFVDLTAGVVAHPAQVLAVASPVGLVRESGPHLAFVTLFPEGLVPLSVLVASSTVQDGHGTPPLLAAFKGAFVVVEPINLAVGATSELCCCPPAGNET